MAKKDNKQRMAVKVVQWRDQEDGFTYIHEPEIDSVTVERFPDTGIINVKYLTHDDMAESPDKWDDTGAFLVNYHRDCWITKDEIITMTDARNYFQQNFEDYNDNRFPLEDEYYLYPVACLVHSGVWLSLARSFSCDPGGWDTSRVGLVLVKKTECNDKDHADKIAQGIINTWNEYLSGDVWACCCQVYDAQWNFIGADTVWGYYGYNNALECLEEFEPNIKTSINGYTTDGEYKTITIQDIGNGNGNN